MLNLWLGNPSMEAQGFSIKLRLISMGLLVSGSIFGQELQLFEETESPGTSSERSSFGQPTRDRDGNIVTEPPFTLIGTSKIGLSNFLIIQDREGETITITVNGGESRMIPGHRDYKVIGISSGEATIAFPDGIPCIEFREQGVTCESAEVARISLTNQGPIARSFTGEVNTLGGAINASEGDTRNPFEAFLQRSADQNTADDTTVFEPRRIDPKDVPAGMKVVSTPFGDRLVEDSGC